MLHHWLWRWRKRPSDKERSQPLLVGEKGFGTDSPLGSPGGCKPANILILTQ